MEKWKEKLINLLQKYSADVGMIYRLNPEDNYLYLVAHIGDFPEQMMGIMSKIPIGKGIAGETALSKEPVVACNLTGEDAPACARPLAKTLGIHGMISVPLLKDQEVIGTLGLGCYSEHAFTETEISELLKIGNDFAEELAEAE